MGRARAAFNAALHPRGPDGRFVGKGSLGSKVIGASERGDRSVPSPKGTAAARFAALKDAQYARVNAATKESRAVDLARAVHLKPDGKGGYTNVGTISREDAAKIMQGDAKPPTPRQGRAAAKMAKAKPTTPVVRGAGVFSTNPEIRAAAERGIDESNRQVAASKARLAKADAPSGGRFANADADMRAMTSREAGEAYLAGATKAQLVEVAKAVGVADTRHNKDTLRKRIIEHAIGYRLNSQTIRDGAWNRSPVGAPAAQIHDAYNRLATRPGDWVPLADLRDHLAGMDRRDVDAALESLAMRPGVQVIPWDNRKALTGRDRASALRFGGEDNHAIRIEPAELTPSPTTPAKTTARSRLKPPSAPSGSSFIPAAVAEQVIKLKTEAEIVQHLADLSAPDLRRVAREMNAMDIPRGVNGREAIRAYIAKTLVGPKRWSGRWSGPRA